LNGPAPAPADVALVDRARSGDPRAFELIVLRYRGPLAAFVRRRLQVTGLAQLDDVLQEVFFTTYLRIVETDQPMYLRGWLYRCAHNACVDELRRPVHLELHDDVRQAHTDPVELRARLRSVVDAVAALPPRQARALMIRAVDGGSYRDIATQLDLTPVAVKSLIHRGRAQLRSLADVA
jgi:RNA polymerase sigma-70 factor (ECF subfamily)